MGFRFSNFSGDPFAITTVSFGVISWIIAIVGVAISPASAKLRFTWWGLAYEIILIMAIFLLYLNKNIELYKFTLVALLAAAFVYTTNSTNTLIYHSHSLGHMCCAAGCILLSALNVLWVIYFGGHPESPTNQYVDSFSVNHNTFSHGQLPSTATKNIRNNENDSGMPRTASQSFPSIKSRQSHMSLRNTRHMFSSLNGMENTNLHSPNLYSPNIHSHFQSNSNSPNIQSNFNSHSNPSPNLSSDPSFNVQPNASFNVQTNAGFKSPVSPFWNNHGV